MATKGITQPPSKSCVVAGHICLDVIPPLIGAGDFEAVFRPGRLLETGPALMSTGGAVSNTGLALHKLGIDTRLMGKVGDDTFGRVILNLISSVADQLVSGMSVIPGEASSYTIILNPPHTDRIFLHCAGANNTFAADDINYNLLRQVALFHFGYPPLMKRMYRHNGAELIKAFRQAKTTGVTTSLDMAMPDPNGPSGQVNWPAILGEVLPSVDLFTPSIEEILLMLYPATFKEVAGQARPITPALASKIADDLLALGAKVVLLKAGHLGLYLRTANQAGLSGMGRARPANPARWANRELWSPVFAVNVMGTTGAGDATIAGFLAAFLRDLPPTEAVTIAAAVGGCNVEAADAVSGIRSWEKTLARLEAGWPRQKLNFDDPGWWFDETRHLWVGPHDALKQ
ncbi:MAG: carbohydrate kinase family protein [Anaerolineae bacterium]|nr:carbohydrate kinase family protein [Anaerolineae bacterium]